MKLPARSRLAVASAMPASPGLVPAGRPPLVARIYAVLARGWQWLAAQRQARTETRQLRVVETVQLGERRFVALLAVGEQRLLIGGAAGQLSLLTRLDAVGPGAGAADAEQP